MFSRCKGTCIQWKWNSKIPTKIITHRNISQNNHSMFLGFFRILFSPTWKQVYRGGSMQHNLESKVQWLWGTKQNRGLKCIFMLEKDQNFNQVYHVCASENFVQYHLNQFWLSVVNSEVLPLRRGPDHDCNHKSSSLLLACHFWPSLKYELISALSTSDEWKHKSEILYISWIAGEKSLRDLDCNIRSFSSLISLVSFGPPIITSPTNLLSIKVWVLISDFWSPQKFKQSSRAPFRSCQHAELPSAALKIAHYESSDRVFGGQKAT